jgi:uncharacterized membrane protein
MTLSTAIPFSGLATIFGVAPDVFWPYFAGLVIAAIGLVFLFRRDLPQAHGIDKAVALARLFIAVPMAVFGAEHFMFWREMQPMVPSYIPWHAFWIFLVGTALILAALSIVTGRLSGLAAALLSAMIFSFVLLLHIPSAIATHGDRFRIAVALRDSSFSAGALAVAIAQAQHSRSTPALLRLVRAIFGLVTIVFGVEHFLHPQNVPVIPLELLIPAWIPGHLPLSYLTGAVMLVCGFGILWGAYARLAATWLGIYSSAVVLLVYLPILLAKPGSIGVGVNYFADTLLYCGCALAVAQALPHAPQRLTAPVPTTAPQRA